MTNVLCEGKSGELLSSLEFHEKLVRELQGDMYGLSVSQVTLTLMCMQSINVCSLSIPTCIVYFMT